MKLRIPPTRKSTQNPANFHTCTFLFSNIRDPSINPQLMGEGLEQLMDSFCSGCKAGARTAESGVCWGCYQLQELVSFFILFLFHIILNQKHSL